MIVQCAPKHAPGIVCNRQMWCCSRPCHNCPTQTWGVWCMRVTVVAQHVGRWYAKCVRLVMCVVVGCGCTMARHAYFWCARERECVFGPRVQRNANPYDGVRAHLAEVRARKYFARPPCGGAHEQVFPLLAEVEYPVLFTASRSPLRRYREILLPWVSDPMKGTGPFHFSVLFSKVS